MRVSLNIWIATQFAGNRQQSRFLALVSNADLIRENIKVAEASEDTGTLQALKALDSLESKINQVQVAYQQFYTSIGVEQVWKTSLDWIKNFIDGLNSLPKAFGVIPLNAASVIYDTITILKKGLYEAFSFIVKQINDSGLLDKLRESGAKSAEVRNKAFIDKTKEGAPEVQQAIKEQTEPSATTGGTSDAVPEAERTQISNYFTAKAAYWREQAEKYRQDIEKTQQELNERSATVNLRTFTLANVMEDQKGQPTVVGQGVNQIREELAKLAKEANYTSEALERVINPKYNPTTNELGAVLQEIIKATKGIDTSTVEDLNVKIRDLASSANRADVLGNVFERIGNFATAAREKITNLTSSIGTLIKNNTDKLNNFSMGLNVAASAIDKSSREGQVLSGTLMSISGATRIATGIISGDFASAVMGAITLVNGFSFIIETSEEKLERLSKEAEELNNEAKKVKADYNTIQRTADKIDELKEKRYESIEAEQEYHDALNELGKQFPGLITSIDELGNVTIETSGIEYELEKAREAAAKATLKAAKADREVAEERLKAAEEERNKQRENIKNNGIYAIPFTNAVTLDSTTLTELGILTENKNPFELPSLVRIMSEASQSWDSGITNVDGQPLSALNVQGFLDMLYNTLAGRNTDLSGIIEYADNGQYKLLNAEELKNLLVNNAEQLGLYYNEAIRSLFENYIDLVDISDNEKVVDINNRIAGLAEKEGEAFDQELAAILQEIDEAGLRKLYPEFIKFVEPYTEGLQAVSSANQALQAAQKSEIGSKVNELKKVKADLFEENEGFQTLLTIGLYEEADAYAQGLDEITKKAQYKPGSDEYQQRYQEFLDNEINPSFEEFKESLTADQWEALGKYWEQIDRYTLQDWQELFDLEEGSKLYEYLDSYYKTRNNQIEILKAQAEKLAKKGIDTSYVYSDISVDLSKFLSTGNKLVETYIKDGYLATAQEVYDSLTNIHRSQRRLSGEESGLAASILGGIENLNIEDIDKAIKQFEDLNDEDAYTDIISQLNELRNDLLTNLPLSIQAAISEVSTMVDEAADDISKAYKGFSKFSEALEFVEKLNSGLEEGEEEYSINDLKWDGKKYQPSNEILIKYAEDRQAEINAELEKIDGLIEAAVPKATDSTLALPHHLSMISRLNGLLIGAKEDVISNSSDEKLFNILQTAELIKVDEKTGEFTLSEVLQDAINEGGENFNIIDWVIEYLKSQKKALEESGIYLENQAEALQADVNKEARDKLIAVASELNTQVGAIVSKETKVILENAGYSLTNIEGTEDYRVTSTSLGDSAKAWRIYRAQLIASGEATTEQINQATKSILEADRGAESRAISVMSKAAKMSMSDFIDILNAEGIKANEHLIHEFKDNNILTELGNGQVRLDYEKFAQEMGWDFNSEEYISAFKSYNDSLIQLNREAEKSILEEADKALRAKAGEQVNITRLTSSLSEEALSNLNQALFDAGAKIENGILNLSDSVNIIAISQNIINAVEDAAEITAEEKAKLLDTFSEILDNNVNLITNGITGKLSKVQAESLKQFASYSLGIDNLDFTRTSEGLKLSAKSAADLYLSLKNVDAIRAKLVFDELNESLKESNENYKNISTITAHIAELEKQIANIPVNDKRRQEYEKELHVAKEIQQVRSLTDGEGDFNFMERSLPNGMQNPLDYWQGVYQWYESMNKAGQNGYMSVQDFYNGVQEATNLAKLTGDDIYFMGEYLNGSAEKASALIEKGMKAISNIDDVGPAIDLARFGNSFLGGAQDMQKGVDKGVKAMADSQIKMLDAMIAALELVVAMENLDDISGEDKKLDFEELFPFYTKDNQNFNLGEAQKKSLQDILDAAKTNKDLALALDTFRINGITMREEMQKAIDGNIENEKEARLFYATLGGLQEALQTGDFTPDNIKRVIIENLQKQLDTEWQDYTLFDGTHVIINSEGTLVETEEGKWQVQGGGTYDTLEKAKKAFDFQKKTSYEALFDESNNPYSEIEVTNGLSIKVVETTNGSVEYHVGDSFITNDKLIAIKKAVGDARGENINYYSEGISEEEIIEYNFIAKFNLTAKEVANLTGKSIGELSDDVLSELGFDTALIKSIEVAVERALTNINLGQLILDGLVSDKLDSKGNVSYDDNPKLIELGRQIGIGIANATNTGLAESLGDQSVKDTIGSTIATGVQGAADSSKVKDTQYEISEARATLDKMIITSVNNASFGSSSLAGLIKKGMSMLFGNNSDITLDSANVGVNKLSIVEVGGVDLKKQLQAEVNAKVDSVNVDSIKQATNSIQDMIGDVVNALGKLTTALKNIPDKSTIVGNTATSMGQLPDKSVAVGNTASQMNQLPDKSEAVGKTAAAMGNLPNKSRAVQATADAMANLESKKISVTGKVDVEVSTYGAVKSRTELYGTWAKGNVGDALAAGKKQKLMGELGPELVVSNGRYFVVGQNGAEMVDLDDDAIVFNHLQTKKLLSTGKAGRGTPITNEKKAVAYASGTGEALASAESTLNLLKQLRAMWQAMLKASSKQLGSMAGIAAAKDKSSSSGSNGSDSDANKAVEIKRTTAEIQRWYNLLRQIEKIEQDLAFQEKLISRYQSDRIGNGEKIYGSYKRQLDLLTTEVAKNQQLADLQKDWYDKKRNELANSSYGLIFNYTEDGLQQYVDGKNRGLDVLEKLNEQTIYGEGINAAESARSQLSYLQSIGFSLNDLNFGENGRVAKNIVNLDTMYNESGELLQGQDLANAQVALMENFWAGIDGWRDELDDLYDSYREQEDKVIENQNKQNEIFQAIRDNQIEVENKVLDAIVEARQREIDELQKNRDAYQQSVDKMVNGLNQALSEERRLYQTQQDKDDLTKMQRQLAILQRSGGSSSQIKALQDQINSKQQEMYFDAREQQIQDIQDAANKQIEQLDAQIDLMTESLEYEKENGLLWQQVQEILAGTPEQITDFISQNSAQYGSEGATEVGKDIVDLQDKVGLFTSSRDGDFYNYYDKQVTSQQNAEERRISNINTAVDKNTQNNYTYADNLSRQISNSVDGAAGSIVGAINNNSNSEVTSTYIDTPAPETTVNLDSSPAPEPPAPTPTPAPAPESPAPTPAPAASQYWGEGTIKKGFQYYTYANATTNNKGPILADDEKGAKYKIIQVSGDRAQIDEVYDNGKRATKFDKRWMTYNNKKHHTWKKYIEGGLVDYTGPAWVDGSPKKPELFLNSKQTQYIRDNLDSLINFEHTLPKSIESLNNLRNNLSETFVNNNEGINIENIELNMTVSQLNSSYDARKAGGDILDEIVRIARKSGGYNGVSRR